MAKKLESEEQLITRYVRIDLDKIPMWGDARDTTVASKGVEGVLLVPHLSLLDIARAVGIKRLVVVGVKRPRFGQCGLWVS